MQDDPSQSRLSGRSVLRKRLTLAVWLGVLLFSFGVGWLASLPPYYRTRLTFNMLLDQEPSAVDPLGKRPANDRGFDPYAVTRAMEEVQSSALWKEAIKRSGVAREEREPRQEVSQIALQRIVERLHARLEVNQWRSTELFDLRVDGLHPDDDAKLARAIADAYLEPRRIKLGLPQLANSLHSNEQPSFSLDTPIGFVAEPTTDRWPHPQRNRAAGVVGAGLLAACVSRILLSRMKESPP